MGACAWQATPTGLAIADGIAAGDGRILAACRDRAGPAAAASAGPTTTVADRNGFRHVASTATLAEAPAAAAARRLAAPSAAAAAAAQSSAATAAAAALAKRSAAAALTMVSTATPVGAFFGG
eukprot:353015-Chlamydomonas_euryale.AAC.5